MYADRSHFILAVCAGLCLLVECVGWVLARAAAWGLLVVLVATSAMAQPAADAPLAPVTLEVQRAHVLAVDGHWEWLEGGVCQNEPAAVNTANRILELEHRERNVALLVGAALVGGFTAGFTVALLRRR